MPSTWSIHTKVNVPLINRAVEILTRVLRERAGLAVRMMAPEEANLVLDVAPGLGAEGFRIADGPGGQLCITGDCARGVLYGVGKLLHEARYGPGIFMPGPWRGISVPDCPLRGIYFALHNNYYSHAPLEELARYLEELALWGINTIAFHLPQPVDPTTPAARAAQARHHALLQSAREAGMRLALLNSPNIGLADAPPEALAAAFPDTEPARRGFADIRVCPSHPAGFAYLSRMLAQYLDGYQDLGLDYVASFPYDSGGCGCTDCWPWGARGFLTIAREFSRLARAMYPGARTILGTWCFDVREESDGEWDGLARALAEDRSWVDVLMVDSHFDFPRYPLEHGAPGGLPLINFAEISMWGRFPWGGYGANPLPARFQRIWEQTGGKLAGGLPYSEGNFEDLNKVIFARFFWDKQAQAIDTVRAYITYEFGPEVVEPVAEAVTLLERSYPRATWRRDDVTRAFTLLQQAAAVLPERVRATWRWRILYLRALLDDELIRHDQPTDHSDAAMEELIRIFHLEDGWCCVTPPSRAYRARQAEKQPTALPPGA